MFVINKTGYIDFYSQGYEVFNAEQLDNGTRSITLTPTNGSEVLVFEPSKWSASIIYTKADGHVCFNGVIINDDHSLTIELTEQMLAVEGKCVAQLYMANLIDGSIIKSTTFVVNVNKALAMDDIESSDEMNALNALFNQISKEYEKISDILLKGDEINALYNRSVEINEQTLSTLDTANQTLETTNQALESANQAIQTANSINSTAEASADDAKDSATLSESYAIGGTNTRDGENTDNSKYYSQQAQASKDQAQNMLTETQQILEEVNKKLVYTEFTINFETGQLEYNDLSAHNYEFTVNHDNGNLEWSVII